MTAAQRCTACGAEIPADAPQGQCPNCLLQAGYASRPGMGPTQPYPPQSTFVAPSVEELQPKFPQFEILELLGKGGMGAVYKARQPGLDRLVAVKILPPETSQDPTFAERFQREARALARMSHPHIVAVYDFGQTGGLCYFVMEYVDGTNLRQALRTGTLKSQEALAIVPQICEALQFAHDEGIVHRDIKPENILIDKRGRVKIADFGLAKLLGHDNGDLPLTGTHQVMGTLRYMAPEQMQGSREVDHRADIYSLGVVFYELLTGELPMGKFALPSKKVQIDVRLDEVVLRALEQDPEQRYQHASDVKCDLDSISSVVLPVRRDVPVVVSDEVLFPWLTIGSLVLSTVWAATLLALHAGYLARADWYFKKELPYNYLTSFWTIASIWLALWLTWWWYLLAKRPDTPRSLVDLWNLTQTPDPRVLGVCKAGLAYLAVYMLAILGGWPFGDAVHSSVMIGVIALAPYICMAAVRRAYTERFRQAGSVHAARAASVAASTEPRFSRLAIAGAVWALFGFIAIIPALFFIALSRVWYGTALPTDLIHEQPPLAFTIAMGVLLAIGAGAPIGTTIYGAVAIGHIQRSGGRIIGLPLAVADAILFPLLALDGLILTLVAAAVMAILVLLSPDRPPGGGHVNVPEVLSLLIGIPLSAWIDFLIARAMWRYVTGYAPPPAGARPPA